MEEAETNGEKEKLVKTEEKDDQNETNSRLLYWSLVILGLAILLPFNSFTLAADYFTDKLEGYNIVLDINITFLVLNLAGSLLGVNLIESVSFTRRITIGLLLSSAGIFVIFLFDMVLDLFDDSQLYAFILTVVGVCALGTSVAQTSAYGYTAMLPSKYSQAVMVGESVAGTVVSLTRVITKAATVTNLALGAAIFFGICMGVLLMAVLLFHVSRQAPLVQHHIDLCRAATAVQHEQYRQGEENSRIIDKDGIKTGRNGQRSGYGTSKPSSSNSTRVVTAQEEWAVTQLDVTEAVVNRLKAIRDLWPYVLGIGMTYCVTASLYPAIFVLVESSNLGTWMPILLLCIYNVFDLLGKILSCLGNIWSGVQLMLWSMSRWLFVAVVLLCVMPVSNPILQHEAYSSSFAALLGVTNGYLGSTFMIEASSTIEDARREVAGNIMTLALCFGLSVGAGLAYLWEWVISLTEPS